MKERPIIFNSEMVRAILDGRKTQTRRVIKPQPPESHEDPWLRKDGVWISTYNEPPHILVDYEIKCPFGQPGDSLWVKEAFAFPSGRDNTKPSQVPDWSLIWYKSDGEIRHKKRSPEARHGRWRSSIFMPRWVSRITLKVTSIRVERVQDISEEDAQAEGVEATMVDEVPNGYLISDLGKTVLISAVEEFSFLWDSINAKRGHPWGSNPWVWVIEFERVDHDQTKEKTD